jgi:hypothetical protein
MYLVNGNYQLSWNSITDQDSIRYNIYRRSNDTVSWSKLVEVKDTTWIDSSILNFNGLCFYQYSVTYENNHHAESKFSSPVSVYTLTDNFNDNIDRWGDTTDSKSDSNYLVVGGQFRIKSIKGWFLGSEAGLNTWKDVIIEVDAKSEPGLDMGDYPYLGIDFRLTIKDSLPIFYEYTIYHNYSTSFQKYESENWSIISRIDSKPNIYQWNKYRVEMVGTSCKGFINGRLENSVDLNRDILTKGNIGLATGDGVTTYFDNVKVLVTNWDTTQAIRKLTNITTVSRFYNSKAYLMSK